MKKILVLGGGYSKERAISLDTAKGVLKALKKKGYNVKKLDAKGFFLENLKKLKPKLVFNALHGKYGEDGFIQFILESLKIPYTHSGIFSSSLAMDKKMSKNLFKISKSDLCISTTGIAGPSGGSNKKPLGLVYIGITFNKKTFVIIFCESLKRLVALSGL